MHKKLHTFQEWKDDDDDDDDTCIRLPFHPFISLLFYPIFHFYKISWYYAVLFKSKRAYTQSTHIEFLSSREISEQVENTFCFYFFYILPTEKGRQQEMIEKSEEKN